ncbi:hypothetical protein COW36_04490 [bacterium (Candidatus Blackallbacteria) CG17_big_fil_post_rev_8_21_14_2_50_48_46]|uniref:Uncharacterized protein n=1 Tax=bacterium (Candidatus Blackallbacteria) CG17_big_fil_post_rev_8_21_14_2_50_48_46 TaxID=2014261 RepID=A0A2M7G8Z1_9BACT|nr:MAG: hypothetical protein COW64_04455 [bacterium (Candidatus Blackallbacteria) CG18_big_fil_WC_8_21_14_2_50_49_26]PIW18557.1 MAG: hypothetical protein COW36_04490 [bacterium (Candidatus Blackallbacteria) CG17_big_fil_post_rev_8_21_14_2_50_48_46]PIW46458.1 MAG: hypothetical protein COW20_16190 [bacterium (Candidatus Blackallbacteria) CG13_big_fil_rev_8_21_14_2_50_49_14]
MRYVLVHGFAGNYTTAKPCPWVELLQVSQTLDSIETPAKIGFFLHPTMNDQIAHPKTLLRRRVL